MDSIRSCFILASLTLFVATAAKETLCPDAWMAYNGSCYLFGFDQSLTYVETEHFCNQHKGHMVEVDNVHVNNMLVNVVTHVRGRCWWIGLSDQIVEGEYIWLNSNNVPSFTNWDASQPNSTRNDEDCVAMQDGVHRYRWSVITCVSHCNPVCQIRSGNSPIDVIG